MRREVAKHAELMEGRLLAHESKGGWKECTFQFLLLELRGHVDDLEVAIFEQGRGGYSVLNECADISNFAMMIEDNFRHP